MRPFAKTSQPRGRAIRASEMRGAEWAYGPIRFGFCVKHNSILVSIAVATTRTVLI